MTAISMFSGLAIVVFLSVVGPVSMETDFSKCSFPSNKMKNMMKVFKGKEGKELYYHATHMTYKFLPTLLSSLFIIKRSGNIVTMWHSMEVMSKNGDVICFSNQSKVLLDVKKNQAMSAEEVSGFMIHYQLLHQSAGKVAVLTRYYQKGVENKHFRHVTFATLNPADKLNPVAMAKKFKPFCGDKVNVTPDIFTALKVNTKLGKDCEHVNN